jgi:dipeptidyl aminopeptidase/acylaminoacyl peptidase
MDQTGRASLLAIVDGTVVAKQTMTFEWGISNTAWRPAGDETGGTIVLSTIKPGGPLHLLDVTATTFSGPRQVAHSERSAWPESGRPRKASSHEWLADIGLAHPDLALRAAEVQRTEPDPTGRLIAVAQKTAHNEGFDETQSRWIVGPHDFVVTVYDRESRERLWTHAAPALTDLAWSGDGRRLGVTQDEAGYVLDATTGETLLERRHLGITASGPT